jgi:hypothetical protein
MKAKKMARKNVFRICLVALTMMAAVSVYAAGYYQTYTFYGDTTFTTWVGEQDFDCDGFETDWGSWTPYRTVDVWRCSDDKHMVHNCQEYNYSTQSWESIACP